MSCFLGRLMIWKTHSLIWGPSVGLSGLFIGLIAILGWCYLQKSPRVSNPGNQGRGKSGKTDGSKGRLYRNRKCKSIPLPRFYGGKSREWPWWHLGSPWLKVAGRDISIIRRKKRKQTKSPQVVRQRKKDSERELTPLPWISFYALCLELENL